MEDKKKNNKRKWLENGIKKDDLYSNKKRYPKEFKHGIVEEDFEAWLKKTKLSEKELNNLRLIHAAALGDCVTVKSLLTKNRVNPRKICSVEIAIEAENSDYMRYLGGSAFHWAGNNEVRDLLCRGIDKLEIENEAGLTPLMVCIIDKDIVGIKYWCEKDLLARKNPFSVLSLAAQSPENWYIFECLVFFMPKIQSPEVEELYEQVQTYKNETNEIDTKEGARKILLTIERMRRDLACSLDHDQGVHEKTKQINPQSSLPAGDTTREILAQSQHDSPLNNRSTLFGKHDEKIATTQTIFYGEDEVEVETLSYL